MMHQAVMNESGLETWRVLSKRYNPITPMRGIQLMLKTVVPGKIKKVDAKGKKVTIIHGPLENLDMPSMTMVFKADEALIAKMKEGQNIEFVADRVKGKLTVTAMK